MTKSLIHFQLSHNIYEGINEIFDWYVKSLSK